tara:strand:- start:2022 stop:2453 length:432 start_codon:yes stop_codon:yes gene_type:complete
MYKRVIVAIFVVSIALGALKSFHHFYLERAEQAKQALKYLESDTCTNHKLRVSIGKYQRCAEAEYELAISATTRAMYDLLESYSICGQARCEALSFWFYENRMFIFGFFIFVCWLLYQFLVYQWQIQSVTKFMERQILPVKID